ncbi:MAG TPA: NAD(P)H-hydrate epimerase [Candidatus Limnocylindrales bacterium]|nr:NAD(P)H-hydrate epimerase [Candidatus Limnocylindrales bacterium]
MTGPRIATPAGVPPRTPLPADDAWLGTGGYGLAELAAHWAPAATLPPMSAEAMRGADRRAQRMGVPAELLMEQAGAAVAAAARALLHDVERETAGPVLLLIGAGNNGGDGSVAARHLGAAGIRCAVVLVDAATEPRTPEALRNWRRLEGLALVERLHAATAHDVGLLGHGIERAALIVDALLGTGVRGLLREPVRAAVALARSARASGVPVLAVDAPTALDLTSGEPSDPVVRADVTITFHRPKLGLRTRAGRALAGRVLVAPIGIPPGADPA